VTTEQIAILAGIVGLYLLLAGALIIQSYRLAKRQTLPVEAPPHEVTHQQQESDQLRRALYRQQEENDRLREWSGGCTGPWTPLRLSPRRPSSSPGCP
jgi:hypothetical protein